MRETRRLLTVLFADVVEMGTLVDTWRGPRRLEDVAGVGELSRRRRVALTLRVGINTGEVLVGGPGSPFAAGDLVRDVVNAAARLQTARGETGTYPRLQIGPKHSNTSSYERRRTTF